MPKLRYRHQEEKNFYVLFTEHEVRQILIEAAIAKYRGDIPKEAVNPDVHFDCSNGSSFRGGSVRFAVKSHYELLDGKPVEH